MDEKKMIIRRAGERGHAEHGWLRTWHTFSFADYYDEAWMGFRTLRVINEDFIAPGKGFDLHGHRDMEILTYVMSGALRHVDTMGNNEIIRAGEFQRMTAGTGIQHMEVSATQTEETHLYQIWILPKEKGGQPSWGARPFPRGERSGKFVALASGFDEDGDALKIRTDARVLGATIKAGDTVILGSCR